MKAVETKEKDTKSAESEIRALAEEWAEAVRSKNIDGVMAHYASDITVFGIAAPLHYTGADTHRQHWEQMFASFEGPIGCESRDFQITASGDVAFGTCLNRISGKMKSGEDGGTWVRVTVGYRKLNGNWLVKHEHVSVPFHLDGSFKAALDLEP